MDRHIWFFDLFGCRFIVNMWYVTGSDRIHFYLWALNPAVYLKWISKSFLYKGDFYVLHLWFLAFISNLKRFCSFATCRVNIVTRDRPRFFFYQVGHQITNASIENKYFFSLNNGIVRPNKIINTADKLGTFLINKVCTLKIKVFKKFH